MPLSHQPFHNIPLPIPLHTLSTPSPFPPEITAIMASNHADCRTALFKAFPPLTALTPSELQRSHNLRHTEDRERWIFSRLLLRITLSAVTKTTPQDLKFFYTEFGKPYTHKQSFSLSHCEQYTAIAFGPTHLSLGIDIQELCLPRTAQAISHFLHPHEQSHLHRTPTARYATDCTQFWARKEAFLKALGTGLLRAPEIDDLGPLETPSVPESQGSGHIAYLHHPTDPEHYIALCALNLYGPDFTSS